MLLVNVTIRISDGRLEEVVRSSKGLKDVQNLRPDLEVQLLYGFEDIL